MKQKKKKNVRPKALAPKGFRDYFGADVSARSEMLNSIVKIYHQYGFDPLESPAVETVEALGKYLPDVERPNEGVFSWKDEDESWLALRYDLTAPLSRVYSQFRNQLPSPYRRYALGPVWRNEKPGFGRYKQFYQCDADSVGVPSILADTEMCIMLSEILQILGISKDEFLIRLNNRKILNGVLESIGILNFEDLSVNLLQRGITLRTIDKFDRLGEEGVRSLLGNGRKDESGDFSQGADLSKSQIELIIAFLNAKGKTSGETISNLTDLVGKSTSGRDGIDELESIYGLALDAGCDETTFIIDPAVVRGLGYYTASVFEAELTFEILDEKGRVRQFGSIAGGGRYDDLVKRFTGQEVPATGVSIGVDRLFSALKEKDYFKSNDTGPILVTVMDQLLLREYQTIVQELRGENLRAEMYLGNPKDFGKQLKYADQRNSPIAVIFGSDEAERGVVQVKDLKLGAKLSKNIETNEEWKARPSQVEVKRLDLLAEIKKILVRQ